MAVTIFNGKLNDEQIIEAYSEYLQNHAETCSNKQFQNKENHSALMAYDEFKEYYILKLLGRASEFTANIARDFQYMTFERWARLAV